jgi:ribosomal protein S18 acetylase RimI-like enzyme
MQRVQIRTATSHDGEGIARIYLQSAQHHAAVDPALCHVPDPPRIVERYQTGRQHPEPGPDCITLVAEAGGEILAFVDARVQQQEDPMLPPAPYCYVSEVGVEASHRSRGIGEQLMRAIEEWARSRGAAWVVLEYNNRNPRAGAFYHRIGYQPVSTSAIKWL